MNIVARRKELSHYTKDDLISMANRHNVPSIGVQPIGQVPNKQDLIKWILAWEEKTGKRLTSGE